MADPDTVKRALDRLADRSRGADGTDYRRVIDRAVAVESVDDAAAFLAGTGTDRLEDAVRNARRRGDHAATRRGRRALDALRELRAAARDDGRDHFHSGRGTHLRGGDQPPDE